ASPSKPPVPRFQNALVAEGPQGCYQLSDPTLSGLQGLRSGDGDHLLALETKWQVVEGCSRFGFVAQSFDKVRRLSDDPRCGIKLEIDHDDVAFGDPARGTVRGADPDQALPAHQCDPAAPRMPVDRGGDRGPTAGTQRLHDLFRNFDTRRIAGRNNLGFELHVCVLISL